MRIDRFEGHLHELISKAGAPYESAETFAQAGITDPWYGVVVHLATGATLHLQLIEQDGPPGEDRDQPEEPVTGPAPEPLAVPELPARAPVKIADIDSHLYALVNNSGHPEIAEVQRPSGQPGIKAVMHSKRKVLVMYRYTLKPGEHPSESNLHKLRAEV